MHAYGLRNGSYSMLTFIDNNKNRKLDFDKRGKALEKYATFGDNVFASEEDITFSTTSADFTSENAKLSVRWKE